MMSVLSGNQQGRETGLKLEVWDMKVHKRPQWSSPHFPTIEDTLKQFLSRRYGNAKAPLDLSILAIRDVKDMAISSSGNRIALLVTASYSLNLKQQQQQSSGGSKKKDSSSLSDKSSRGMNQGSLLEVLLKGILDVSSSMEALSPPVTKQFCVVLVRQQASSLAESKQMEAGDFASQEGQGAEGLDVGKKWVHEFSGKNSPEKVVWDDDIDVLLAVWVRTNNISSSPSSSSEKNSKIEDEKEEEGEEEASLKKKRREMQLITFFVSDEKGMHLQNKLPIPSNASQTYLLSLQAPHILLGSSNPSLPTSPSPRQILSLVSAQWMREFEGVGEEVARDPHLREAILTFSYHLSLNQMNKAYSSIRLISSASSSPHLLWRNMCRLSVVSGRVGVSEVCLSQMGHVRGVKMVRERKEELIKKREEYM
jgi:hypothetical protein